MMTKHQLITFDSDAEWSDKYYYGFDLNKPKKNIKFNFEVNKNSFYIVKLVSCIRDFDYNKSKVKNTRYSELKFVYRVVMKVISTTEIYPYELICSMNKKRSIRSGLINNNFNKAYVDKACKDYFVGKKIEQYYYCQDYNLYCKVS